MTTPEGMRHAPQQPPGSAAALAGEQKQVSVTGQGTDRQLMTGIGVVTSITMRTASATAAGAAYLYDGDSASGDLLAIMAAPAGSGANPSTGAIGLQFQIGLYLHVLSGSVDVAVNYLPRVNPI